MPRAISMPPNLQVLSFSVRRGFTLIETIIGIVVLAISFSVISTLIFPAVEQSADQVHQIRAAELAQSMLNEIQAKAFDERSDKAGGRDRCGEDQDDSGAIDSGEKCSTTLGAEPGETRATYDDVDDYDDIDHGQNIKDSLGLGIGVGDLYTGYSIDVEVCNDGDYNGVCSTGTSDLSTAKLITVTVRTLTGGDIVFSAYRANF